MLPQNNLASQEIGQGGEHDDASVGPGEGEDDDGSAAQRGTTHPRLLRACADARSVAAAIAATIDRQFFFFAFALVIPVAARWPGLACTGGPLHPEVSVFWVVIVLIFLLEGLDLPTDAMLAGMRRLETHAAVLLFNLVFFPAVTLAACALLEAAGAPLPPVLREGFIALSAVPTTTSMCSMLSAKSGTSA